jgi:diguanylate cyclase (GGDEF)-like protein/PAS domain S-box-containing protein
LARPDAAAEANPEAPRREGVTIDISEPEPVTEALRESEARLHALLSSLDDLVFELDESGTYLGVWGTDNALLAAPRRDLLGRNVREGIGEEIGLRLTEVIGHVLDTGRPEIWEYCLEVPAGTRWFQGRLAPIAGSGGSPGRICLLVRDITAQKAAAEEASRSLERLELMRELLQERATHDSLTGLLNRGAAVDALDRDLARSRRNGQAVALLFIDLDHLKAINDTFGHEGGDAAIRAVGVALRATTRQEDVVARLGGDEFVVGCLGERDREGPSRLADRIQQQVVSTVVEIGGHRISIDCSIGIALSDACDVVAGSLMHRADQALYLAKAQGRGRVRWFGSAHEQPGDVAGACSPGRGWPSSPQVIAVV